MHVCGKEEHCDVWTGSSIFHDVLQLSTASSPFCSVDVALSKSMSCVHTATSLVKRLTDGGGHGDEADGGYDGGGHGDEADGGYDGDGHDDDDGCDVDGGHDDDVVAMVTMAMIMMIW